MPQTSNTAPQQCQPIQPYQPPDPMSASARDPILRGSALNGVLTAILLPGSWKEKVVAISWIRDPNPSDPTWGTPEKPRGGHHLLSFKNFREPIYTTKKERERPRRSYKHVAAHFIGGRVSRSSSPSHHPDRQTGASIAEVAQRFHPRMVEHHSPAHQRPSSSAAD